MEDEADRIEINPETLAQLLEFNNKINTLFLKHNVSDIEDLKEIRDQLSGEQKGTAEIEAYIAQILENISKKEKSLESLSQKLSKNRKKHSCFHQKSRRFT